MKKLFALIFAIAFSVSSFAEESCTRGEIIKRKAIVVATVVGAGVVTGAAVGVAVSTIPVAVVTVATGTVASSLIPSVVTIGAATAVVGGAIGFIGTMPVMLGEFTCSDVVSQKTLDT